MAFALDLRHPLFAGLGAADTSFWRGDHLVTRKEFVRPAGRGGLATLVVSGGATHNLEA